MSKFLNLIKQTSKLPHQEAFNFLARCSVAKIDMTAAKPILKAPEKILTSFNSSSYQASAEHFTYGAPSRGEDFFLEKVSNFFQRQGIKCGKSNISANMGILNAISEIYQFFDSKTKVLVPVPTFGFYFKQLQNHGIEFEILQTKKSDEFLVNPKDLEEAIKKTGTQVLLLCYPNNPTGKMMTEENAIEISKIVKKHQVFVISDEVFNKNILSSSKRHFPISAIEGMLEQSITLTGPSKSMGLAHLGTSICVGPEWLVEKFSKLGGYPLLDQQIIASALEESEENAKYLEDSRQKYLYNIDLTRERIASLNKKFSEQFGEEKVFVRPFIADPEAGNVYLLEFSGLRGKMHKNGIMNSGLDVAKWLLDDASVGMVPGECSMIDPELMTVRMALGHSPEVIKEAFESIEKAADKIQNVARSPANPVATSLNQQPEKQK